MCPYIKNNIIHNETSIPDFPQLFNINRSSKKRINATPTEIPKKRNPATGLISPKLLAINARIGNMANAIGWKTSLLSFDNIDVTYKAFRPKNYPDIKEIINH